jgi:hypothetical protein
MRSTGTPGVAPPSLKYCSTRVRGKRSMPAGTGVCVVKTVDARPTSRAVSKSSPGPSSQRAHAADAEQQLLAHPVLAVAAVEAVGHVDVVLGVPLDVGVQHQQRHAADAGDPDPGDQVGPTGHRDGDRGARAVGLAQQRDRQAVGVEDRVGLLLPALARQRLAEVAVAVEQAHADDRDAEVARGLEVVAGEDAQAAGVLREDGGDAELRGEVRDRAGSFLRLTPLEPAVAGEVGLQIGAGLAELLQEALVGCQLLEPGPADGAEELDRVPPRRLPQPGVHGLEDVLRLRVPGPAQVARQVAQGAQRRGEDGSDRESSNRSHQRKVA